MSYHRKSINIKYCRVRNKSFLYDILEPIKHYKDWMFTDIHMSRIEILSPTLDNLNMMKEHNMLWVVKGFRNPLEFKIFDHLRVEHGVSSMMFASRSLGSDIMLKAITSMLNNEPMPSKQEVEEAAEDSRFIPVVDGQSEKRIKEREKYRKLYAKYSSILYKKVNCLFRQGRVEYLHT